jgi:hypothetical protein
MPKNLGVWTADECALVLTDYQNEMFEVLLRALARTDIACVQNPLNLAPRRTWR